MYTIDLLVVVSIVLGLMGFAWYTKRYVHGVADFLSANRCAGRYMLSVADGMASLSLAWVLAGTQMTYKVGATGDWWMTLAGIPYFFIAISGWFVYRFRETRALTMAQFYEERYSRKFRIFTGIMGWVAGVIHWGIFPIITAKLIVFLLKLPAEIAIGGVVLPTSGVVMVLLVAIAVYMAVTSGQIAVMVTDFLQGSLTLIVFLVLLVFIFSQFGPSDILESFRMAPENDSMINPFKINRDTNFGISFFLIMTFMGLYKFKIFPGASGYNAAAISPHEARMARVIGTWRLMILSFVMMISTFICYTVINNPKFSSLGSAISGCLSSIPDEQTAGLLRVPVLLQHILPVGMVGLVCAVFVSLAISTDNTNLHSWGSIFVQDIVMPIRNKPLSPKQHLLLLRLAIGLSSLSAIYFGFFFTLKDYLMMFMEVTVAVYIGGAGAVTIGGLYWKRGNTKGAWAGMLTGSGVAVIGILLQNYIWPYVLPGLKESYANMAWLQSLPEQFPVNGLVMSLYSALAASVMYVLVSLLTKDPKTNMDRLLHRGEYAIKGEHRVDDLKPVTGLKSLFNWKSGEFTKGDRLIAMATFGWMMLWVILFIVLTPLALIFGLPDAFWEKFYVFKYSLMFVIAIIAAFWFVLGGFRDLTRMFNLLKTVKRDERDDGRVVNGHNLVDECNEVANETKSI